MHLDAAQVIFFNKKESPHKIPNYPLPAVLCALGPENAFRGGMWSREQALGGVGTPACDLGVHPLWARSVSAPSRVHVCSGRGTSENHTSLTHQFNGSFNGIPCGEGPCGRGLEATE